ncbi:MAG: glycosyl hydrolase [Acidobacteriota bacterium]|nr:glycosyl hydrolase [Acidobacteriota bacterium]
MRYLTMILLLLMGLAAPDLHADKKKKKKKGKEEKAKTEEKSKLNSGTFGAMKFRTVGPALTEGRIGDLAVHPENEAVWYIAVASGGVWKTVNAGTTWKPIFDRYGSYSIGCVTIDPNNPNVVWVGTGENNSQRSVGYGDGIYKSVDGGKTWKNMGLKNSEHISKIVVDPRDSNTIIVASQGPLWSDGGDRGIFRSTDGGETWENTLKVSDKTGCNDLVFDPRNPDIMYTASYQRRRHVWTLINGGPESNIYKSFDGGKTWKKSGRGLPGGDKGRIGLAIAPSQPDTLYAIVEALDNKGGFFRSVNAGDSWQKRSSYVSDSPQYYQEIIVEPHNPDVVYSNDTYLQRSDDGGKTFKNVDGRSKHVDNHVVWIDPRRNDHLLVGCDGGFYETFDRGATWLFRANLPIIQFYKVSTDNAEPFYNIYGGTQDNYSLGGPSRTLNRHGIRNTDWFVTHGGDGFETQVDPTDHNVIYAQSQYGVLVRYDRRSGEEIGIQPQPPKDEVYIWNWDSPLVLSAHSNTRLYFGGNKLFRTDDRGNSWKEISPDMSRGIDRNTLKVMDRVWGVDTVAKNRSTSFYGNLVSLAESVKDENMLVAGTDDGLIHITTDGGANWTRIESVPGIPERTYVNAVAISRHDDNVIYAAFNNHKMGDFKPYLMRSADKGKTWTAITEGLPERGSVYTIVEDHVKPELLFCGTEFGAFMSVDTGAKWIKLSAGLPTISVRDMDIQRRENDLVLGTFGRGFYVLDDYSPLRYVNKENLEKESMVFPVRDAWAYFPSAPLGGGRRGYQGDSLWVADNPPYGAVITYYLPESMKTLVGERKKKESKIAKEGGDTPYPSWDELRKEEREKKPKIILTVTNEAGEVVRRLTGSTSAGFHRVAWDLCWSDNSPITTGSRGRGRGGRGGGNIGPNGVLVLPGAYTVTAARWADGKMEPFGEPQTFQVKSLKLNQFEAEDHDAVAAFRKEMSHLFASARATNTLMSNASSRLTALETAVMRTSKADNSHLVKVHALQERLADLRLIMTGNTTISRRSEPTPPGLTRRVFSVVYGASGTTAPPTQTHLDQMKLVEEGLDDLLKQLKVLVDQDIKQLEEELDAAGAPLTPGRFPTIKRP